MLGLPREIEDPILKHTEQRLFLVFLFAFLFAFFFKATKYDQQSFWKYDLKLMFQHSSV